MLSTAAVIRDEKPNAKIIFISPCIAKKDEIIHEDVKGMVDLVLTFEEIKKLFEDKGIKPSLMDEEELDGYQPYYATSFPVTGGLTRTAMSYLKGREIDDILLEEDLVITEGRDRAIPFLEEYAEKLNKGETDVLPKLVDILYCEGCIDGPTTRKDIPVFEKRRVIVKYTKDRLPKGKKNKMMKNVVSMKDIKKIYERLNFFREFRNRKVDYRTPPEEYIEEILRKTNRLGDERNCEACGYPTCRERAIAVYNGLLPEDMCIIYMMESVEKLLGEVRKAQEESTNMIRKAKELLENIADIVREVTDQAVHLSESSDRIAQESEKGKKVVGNLLEKREHVEDRSKTITGNVEQLKDKSEKLIPISRRKVTSSEERSISSRTSWTTYPRSTRRYRIFSVQPKR